MKLPVFSASNCENIARLLIFTAGFGLLYFGSTEYAHASIGNGHIIVDDTRLIEVLRAVLEYLEGSFGALIMVGAGVFAILSAAFGQYRAALGLLVVAIGSFTLRSFISTFFNVTTLNE